MIRILEMRDIILRRNLGFFLLMALWVFSNSFAGIAFAQPEDGEAEAEIPCIPGLPCVDVLTEEQLTNPLLGPNADKLELPASVVPSAAVDGGAPGSSGAIYNSTNPAPAAVDGGTFEATPGDSSDSVGYSNPTAASTSALAYAATLSSAPVTNADAALKSNVCDANFMNQITAKAFMEAEREVLVNSTLMKKPDSVLEYSCFDQSVANLVTGLSSVSGNRCSLEFVLEGIVLKSLSEYIDIHFFHTYLNGQSAFDCTISNSVAGVENVCDHIYNMHYGTQCENIDAIVPFMDFEFLVATDPRNLAVPDDARMQCDGGTQITQALIDVAENLGKAYVQFDPVDVGLPITLSQLGSGADICENSLAISTGITITREIVDIDNSGGRNVDTTTFPEHICSVPGCYYDQDSSRCVE